MSAAPYVRLNTQVLVDAFDLSAFSTMADSDVVTADVLTTTNMASGGYRQVIPGKKAYSAKFGGNADLSAASAVSNALQALWNTQTVVTINELMTPTAAVAAGTTSWFTRGVLKSFTAWDGAVNTVAQFAAALDADTAAVAGVVGMPLQALTTSGFTSSAIAMTGPTATQSLYATLHVSAAAGTNLVVKVRSSTTSGGAYTDRLTFSTVTTGGTDGYWAVPVAGAITDGFWKVVATVATSTFTAACSFGVL